MAIFFIIHTRDSSRRWLNFCDNRCLCSRPDIIGRSRDCHFVFSIRENIPFILKPSCWDKVDKVSSELGIYFWLSVGSDLVGKISENDGYCCVDDNSGFKSTGIGGSSRILGWEIDDGGIGTGVELSIKLNKFSMMKQQWIFTLDEFQMN